MENLGSSISEMFDLSEIKANLELRYNEALKNKFFQEFVHKSNLSDDILMRYTSKILESISEKEQCKRCLGLVDCKNKVKGYYPELFISNNRVDYNYMPCNYQQLLNEELENAKRVYFKNVPEELRRASLHSLDKSDNRRIDALEKIYTFMQDYLDDKKPKGLYLYGSFGGGKTYLLAVMANTLAAKKVYSAIVYYPELLLSLKSSFNQDFYDQFTYIREIQILILDDLGAENMTPWSRDEILGPILQYRMQENLPTFFTSNFSIEELEEHFSNGGKEKVKARRIIERIKYLSQEIKVETDNKRL